MRQKRLSPAVTTLRCPCGGVLLSFILANNFSPIPQLGRRQCRRGLVSRLNQTLTISAALLPREANKSWDPCRSFYTRRTTRNKSPPAVIWTSWCGGRAADLKRMSRKRSKLTRANVQRNKILDKQTKRRADRPKSLLSLRNLVPHDHE